MQAEVPWALQLLVSHVTLTSNDTIHTPPSNREPSSARHSWCNASSVWSRGHRGTASRANTGYLGRRARRNIGRPFHILIHLLSHSRLILRKQKPLQAQIHNERLPTHLHTEITSHTHIHHPRRTWLSAAEAILHHPSHLFRCTRPADANRNALLHAILHLHHRIAHTHIPVHAHAHAHRPHHVCHIHHHSRTHHSRSWPTRIHESRHSRHHHLPHLRRQIRQLIFRHTREILPKTRLFSI